MTKSKKNLSIAILSIVMAVACIFAVGFNKTDVKAEEGAQTFVMTGAGIRFDEPTGIRFTAKVDETTYQSVIDSEDKVFGAIILPNDYLGEVGEITNHVTQLEGIKYNCKEGLLGTEVDGGYKLAYSIAEIQYGNYNRDFYCLIYIKTGEGETATYQYATVVDGNNIANVAEVAEGFYPFAEEEQKEDLLNYVFKAEYLNANPTDSNGETAADEYVTAQISALNSFESAVAEVPAQDVAYVDLLTINSAKAEYAKLGTKGKAFVADEYQAVLESEQALDSADGRIFGDAGMTADLYTQDTNDSNAKSAVATSVIAKDSKLSGQNDYVYAGELGNMIKLSLTKTDVVSSSGAEIGKNWAVNAQFDKVLAVMQATGIESVSFYIYQNNAFKPTIHVGTYWNPFYYESVNPGWKKITYTLEQIESIVNKRNAICSDGTFKDGATFAELWISDFFLNIDDETKVWGASFDANKFVYVDNGWANTTGSTTATLLDGRMQHQGLGDYVYTGEYGSLVKIVATDDGSGDVNWAVKFPMDEVKAAMVAADADYVEMKVYNNSTSRVLVDFGGYADLGHYAKSYKFASGWNVVQITLSELDAMIAENRGWIGHNNVTGAEIWVSDFTLCKIYAEENSTRVLGDLGMLTSFKTGSLTVGGNQRNTVRALAQYVPKDTALVGQESYTYNGEYGSLIKISIPERGGWAIHYNFSAAKQAMADTGAESITIYVYQNNTFANEYFMFGNAWVGWYGKVTNGWNEITLTSSQVDSIVNNGSLVLSDCTFDDQTATTAEYWVSDFFLNMPAD